MGSSSADPRQKSRLGPQPCKAEFPAEAAEEGSGNASTRADGAAQSELEAARGALKESEDSLLKMAQNLKAMEKRVNELQVENGLLKSKPRDSAPLATRGPRPNKNLCPQQCLPSRGLPPAKSAHKASEDELTHAAVRAPAWLAADKGNRWGSPNSKLPRRALSTSSPSKGGLRRVGSASVDALPDVSFDVTEVASLLGEKAELEEKLKRVTMAAASAAEASRKHAEVVKELEGTKKELEELRHAKYNLENAVEGLTAHNAELKKQVEAMQGGKSQSTLFGRSTPKRDHEALQKAHDEIESLKAEIEELKEDYNDKYSTILDKADAAAMDCTFKLTFAMQERDAMEEKMESVLHEAEKVKKSAKAAVLQMKFLCAAKTELGRKLKQELEERQAQATSSVNERAKGGMASVEAASISPGRRRPGNLSLLSLDPNTQEVLME